jgi:hypothetical protein
VIGQEGFVPLKHSRKFTQESRILLGILGCFKAQNKDEQMEYMSWTACYTAVDFRARLRFPRAAGEPPRRLRFCGILFRFSRRSLRLALQSPARSNYIHETYFYHKHKKSERIGFIVRIFL